MEKYDNNEHDGKETDCHQQHHPPHARDEVQGAPEHIRVEKQVGKSKQRPILIHQGAVVEEVAVASEVGTWPAYLDEPAHHVG